MKYFEQKTNHNILNYKQENTKRLEHCDLSLAICLSFGICFLEF